MSYSQTPGRKRSELGSHGALYLQTLASAGEPGDGGKEVPFQMLRVKVQNTPLTYVKKSSLDVLFFKKQVSASTSLEKCGTKHMNKSSRLPLFFDSDKQPGIYVCLIRRSENMLEAACGNKG